MKHTPQAISYLAINEIFVYGANEAGKHGAGAAKTALKWGAKYGKYGLSGQTYGIPTKDSNIDALPISKIKIYVNKFLMFAAGNPQLKFLVTRIGCGLAGYKDEDIAPLFNKALRMDNVFLPIEFSSNLAGPVERMMNDLRRDYEQKK